MDERDIGQNIRRIREAAGLTVTAAAERAGLTKSTLSKIEKGQVSPPISTLVRVAAALQAELAEFFTTAGPRPAFALTRQGQGHILTRDGSRFGYAYEALALDMPGKRAEPFMLTIQPGDPPGDFAHDGQEFIHMLAGSMDFTVGGQTFTLKQGDSLYFDATLPHRTQVRGKQAARFLCLFINDMTKPVGRVTRPGRPSQPPQAIPARTRQVGRSPASPSRKPSADRLAPSPKKPATPATRKARRPASKPTTPTRRRTAQ